MKHWSNLNKGGHCPRVNNNIEEHWWWWWRWWVHGHGWSDSTIQWWAPPQKRRSLSLSPDRSLSFLLQLVVPLPTIFLLVNFSLLPMLHYTRLWWWVSGLVWCIFWPSYHILLLLLCSSVIVMSGAGRAHPSPALTSPSHRTLRRPIGQSGNHEKRLAVTSMSSWSPELCRWTKPLSPIEPFRNLNGAISFSSAQHHLPWDKSLSDKTFLGQRAWWTCDSENTCLSPTTKTPHVCQICNCQPQGGGATNNEYSEFQSGLKPKNYIFTSPAWWMAVACGCRWLNRAIFWSGCAGQMFPSLHPAAKPLPKSYLTQPNSQPATIYFSGNPSSSLQSLRSPFNYFRLHYFPI